MRSADEPIHPEPDGAVTDRPEPDTPQPTPDREPDGAEEAVGGPDGSIEEPLGDVDWLGERDMPAGRHPGRRTTLVVAVLGLVSALVALLLCCQGVGLLLSGLNDEVCRSQLCPPTQR